MKYIITALGAVAIGFGVMVLTKSPSASLCISSGVCMLFTALISAIEDKK